MEPEHSPTGPPVPAATAAPSERGTQTSRTSTGLMLLALAAIVQWIPTVGWIGLVPGAIGAVLMLLGVGAFGERHRTLVWASVLVFIFAEALAFLLGVSLAASLGAEAGATGPSAAGTVLGTMDATLEGAIVAGVLSSVAWALIAFALEDHVGQALLLASVVATALIGVALFVFILDPLIHAAITQAYASSPPNAQVIENADASLHGITAVVALDAIPPIPVAAAYVWAVHRIDRHVIPLPAPPTAKTSKALLAALVALVVLVPAGVAGGIATGGLATVPPPPPHWVTVATFTGNTTGRTANFTVTAASSTINESVFCTASCEFDYSVYAAGSGTWEGSGGMGGGGGGPMQGGGSGPGGGTYYIVVTKMDNVASWRLDVVELV